jgi:hypothetical protein
VRERAVSGFQFSVFGFQFPLRCRFDAARCCPMLLDAARCCSMPLDAARCRSMPLDAASMPLDPTSRRDRFFDNKMPHDVLSSNRSVLTHVELKERLNSMRIVDADLSKAHSSPNERLELGRRDFAQTLESCDFSVANSFHGIVTFSF